MVSFHLSADFLLVKIKFLINAQYNAQKRIVIKMDFTNKTVLVTGSSRGIGKAIAFAFGRAGARVVLNASRSKDQLAEAKKELEEMGVSCMAILADVSDYNACKDMFLQIQDAFGPVDILVNNAGISHIGLFTDMTPEQWQHVLNVNLGSVLNCTHWQYLPWYTTKQA